MNASGEEAAEALALRALAHLVADAAERRALMAQTGVDAAGLRARAGEPEFLAGVLDFLLADERRLVRFCERHEIAPDRPARARSMLPGGRPTWP